MKLLHPHNYTKRLTNWVILLEILIILIALCCPMVTADREVKVALTELKPSLFTDDLGNPAGFFVDLITDLARQKGWDIVWVEGSLTNNWEHLSSGEIDLIMGVAATPEREENFAFSNESAFSVWSQVYARPFSGINTILDIEGKRIAIINGSSCGTGFRDIAQKFGVNATYLVKNSPEDAFEAVISGEADALVVYNTAGQGLAQPYGLAGTPLMFNPTGLGFALKKGKNFDILQDINNYIHKAKNDPSSVYYRSMQKWYGIETSETIPTWIWLGLGTTALLAALFVGMSYILRREVRRKTAELAKQNEELHSEVLNRRHAETELVRKNSELMATYEELEAMDEELRHNFTELSKSEEALMQARKKLNLLSKLTIRDIKNAFFILSGYIQLSKDAESIDEAMDCFTKEEKILQSVEHILVFLEKYQNLGIKPPKWQNVQLTLINAISHLDFSKISRTEEIPEIEIFADPLLEDVFLALMETIIRQGPTTHVGLRYRQNPESITILVESNGPGIPDIDKEKIFAWENTGKDATSLFLAREILSITKISLEETGEPDTGICFEITVPKEEYRIIDA
ncbi:transporter substrate-binding domain-containing protein [Methanospirillum stamsii]|uniref:Solute-binding protein family 3/N-terminal domain-containing protein n=2 Tax=Methanospirillum stamsii TaxID=1277351 RepID=A0A2V2N444_9EURY|nr:transporter substrate-binding domain-containing protein [Methanospirillum stamsii]PWR74924.1 hypothetical protein DLD82_06765 [Methanospirillum stamsii]